MSKRELGFDDYISILRRRWWIVLIPALLGPAIGYLVALKLPARYSSEAKIMVEQPKVSADIVRPVITDSVFQRLIIMQQQLLTRTRLQPIIERYGLYKESAKLGVEERVVSMRKNILIVPLATETQGRMATAGFSLQFTANEPRVAQQVCQELTSMFIEENLRVREESTQGTSEFLQKQLDEAKQKLDENDRQLAEFKGKHLGQLPGQEDTNMNVLRTLNSQLDANTQMLSRLQQEKTYTDSMLAQQVEAWQATQRGSNPVSLEQELGKMQDQLVVLESRYTADHPDVRKLRNEIAQMRKKIDQANAETGNGNAPKKPTKGEPPTILQMRRQVMEYQQAINAKTHEQERLKQQIGLYQGRVQLSPLVEEQYKALTRDYDSALQNYNDLLKKKTQSDIAGDLERRQQGEQFRLIDPPNFPIKPSFPDRLQFALAGLGGGFALGFGIVLLLEMKDKSLRNEKDVAHLLELPTLAVLPWIGEEAGNGDRRRMWKRKTTSPPARAGMEAENRHV